MPIIKGPFKFNGSKELYNKIIETAEQGSVKLPFSATGWKADKSPVFVEEGKELAKINVEKQPYADKYVKKVKEEPKVVPKEEPKAEVPKSEPKAEPVKESPVKKGIKKVLGRK